MRDYTAPQRDKVALLTINAQRDFLDNESPLRTSGMEQALHSVASVVGGFRSRGLPIIHCVRLYRPDGSNVDICRRHMVEEGLRVLMPGTMGAELSQEVTPPNPPRLTPEPLMEGEMQLIGPNEWAMYRPRWGAFFDTPLEAHLKSLDVSTVVICGFNFSTSIRATIYDAGARDLRTVLVADAVSNASESAISELGRIGVYLMTASQCLAWVAGAPVQVAAE